MDRLIGSVYLSLTAQEFAILQLVLGTWMHHVPFWHQCSYIVWNGIFLSDNVILLLILLESVVVAAVAAAMAHPP